MQKLTIASLVDVRLPAATVVRPRGSAPPPSRRCRPPLEAAWRWQTGGNAVGPRVGASFWWHMPPPTSSQQLEPRPGWTWAWPGELRADDCDLCLAVDAAESAAGTAGHHSQQKLT